MLFRSIKIDYPYILEENAYTGKSIINNIPCNIFSAIKILKGEIRFLSSEKGVTGYPFKVCLDSKCSPSNIPKFGIKVLPYVNDRDWVSYDCVREHQKKIKGKKKSGGRSPRHARLLLVSLARQPIAVHQFQLIVEH